VPSQGLPFSRLLHLREVRDKGDEAAPNRTVTLARVRHFDPPQGPKILKKPSNC
jgi:hypothetical protein